MMESVDISIKWPFKWCLVGSSGSGKTNFSLDIVKNRIRIFDTLPSKLIVIYREFQNIYTQFQDCIPTQLINESDADIDELNKHNKENLLIICDDLFFSQKLHEISEQFLVKGRHRNTSWIVLTQTIFNNPALKNISRNSNHITLFKSVRLNEPHIFFSQLRPKSSKILQDIYAKATEKAYSYLDIDLSQTCSDKYRFKSNLFDKFVTVYIIMNPATFKTMYLIGKSDLDKMEVQSSEQMSEELVSANNKETNNGSIVSNVIQNTPEPINAQTETKKAIDVENDNDLQLKRGKHFRHYSFLKPNEIKSLLSEKEPNEMQQQQDQLTKNNEKKTKHTENKSILAVDKQENLPKKNEKKPKKNEIGKKEGDQWIRSLKTKSKHQLKSNKNQSKYKTVSFDAKKSLIKPSDFKFLSGNQVKNISKKWKPLKKTKKSSYRMQKFKAYKDF